MISLLNLNKVGGAPEATLLRKVIELSNSFFETAEKEEFFSEIRERFASVIHKRICSDEYEDVVQAAMVELRSRIQEITEESQLMPQVFLILKDSIREYYQQKKREEKVLEFSPDSFFYYQPEIGEEEWQEVAKKGILRLEEEQPRSAALLRAVLKSSTMENLSQKLEMERLNVYRMLYRCRSELMKVVTETLKIPLP